MRQEFLPFSPPFIGPEEIAEVVDSLQSGWITTGPKTKDFEARFAAFTGAPAALALNSCTAALHMALVCLDIGPGDEVITTCLTFAATVGVIEHTGATPILVDVTPDTLNMDPEKVAAAITDRTRAVIAVHFGGHPCELDRLREICRERNLILVEDAAHSLPAWYQGRLVGDCDNPVAFSFYATKNLTTAEGGMLTGAAELVERGVVASLHGMNKDAWKRNSEQGNWRYDIVMPGFKYNMPDIMAAMGLRQLDRLLDMHAKRETIVARYREGLEPLGAFDLPVEREDCRSAWHLFPIRLRAGVLNIDRDEFIERMKALNIGTSVHFIPIHTFTYYREKYGFQPGDFPVALAESDRILSLPLHPGLTDSDVDDVMSAVTEIVESCRP